MVNILPNEAQKLVIDGVAEVLANECPVDRLRKPRTSEDESRVLRRFAELGWFAIQSHDDADRSFGLAEEMLMFREFGRFLLSPALLVQGLGARLAALGGDAELSARLSAGNESVTLVHAWDQGAGLGAGGVNGKVLLIDAPEARFGVLVDERGAALLRLDGLSALQRVTAMDDALVLRTATARQLHPVAFLDDQRAWLRLRLLSAAQLVGGAEASRDMAATYAKLRQQFGKPIGSFQAIAHHCADMAVRAEAAWCQTLIAAIVLRDARDDASFQLAAALHVACDAAFQNATLNIRVHGGMGFTADCHAQRYLKRAVLLREIAGGSMLNDGALLAR